MNAGFQNVPSVVPAECITYLSPDFSIRRWTSAIWEDTEGEEVPICDLRTQGQYLYVCAGRLEHPSGLMGYGVVWVDG
jgi:hypothetical protein